MKRLKLFSGQTVVKATGGSLAFGQGFHNVQEPITDDLAKSWIVTGVGTWVDENENPCEKPVDIKKDKKAKKGKV